MSRIARFAVLATAALGGCSDLLPDAERVPTRIELSTDTVTVTEGNPVPLEVRVMDQHGRPFERLPRWAAPVWVFDQSARVEDRGGELVALQSGPAWGTVSVAGLGASVLVKVNPRALRLTVDGLYLTQSVQSYDRSVPLVAGRDAFLRVFLRGDQPSFFRPSVRVGIYHGGVLQETATLAPEGDSIPVTVRERNYAGSWNGYLPGRLVRPGMSVVVEADPDGVVPLREGSQPRYPAAGTLALDVRAVPKFWLRLVPIRQTQHGTTGNVAEANRESWLRDLLAMFPIGEYDADIRTAYSTSSSASTGLGWEDILMEMAALRVAEGSRRFYYGILKHPGGNSIGGIGYVGGLPGAEPAAVGYDVLPAGAGTLAHEMGHNMGRRHSPCGGAGNPDQKYPYPNGGIGVHGYDVARQEAKDPGIEKDLMSYCGPEWISDYTYRGILQFRLNGDGGTSGDVAAAEAEPSLLVWGRVDGAEATLEPAFEITTRPVLPARPGPYRVEGLDAAGAVLFSLAFAGQEIADGDPDSRHFAFAVPARLAQPDRLARLRLIGPGAVAERRREDAPPARRAPTAALRRRSGGEVRLEWDDARRPMALVRDPATGEILSFARDGGAALRTRSPQLEVLFSDGVRTTRSTLRVQ